MDFFVDLRNVDCVLLVLVSFKRLLLCLDMHRRLMGAVDRNIVFIFLSQLVQIYLDLLG